MNGHADLNEKLFVFGGSHGHRSDLTESCVHGTVPYFFVWESKCYYKVCSISRDLVRTIIVHTIKLFSNGVRMVVSIVALG